ncbi:MAG: outer membrane protein assembly factor BamA, partial [Candidatus Zixiibacteriota bacterium]
MNHRRARIALLVLIVSMLAVSGLHAQQEYRVVDIEVVGNRVATPSLILGVSSIQKGVALSPTMIEETIRRLYGLAIFSDVTIEAEQVTGGLKVYIVLKELPKLAGLHITGSEKIKPKDILEKLRLGVGGYISPSLIFEKQEEIRTMYTDKGYFQAKVTPELVYSADSSEATLTYKVEERSKVKVEKVVMTGNVRVPSKDLIGKMRNRHRGFLKSSDFAQDKYEEDMQKVVDEYHKKGFLDAYLISDSTSIDTVSNRMTVFVNLYEGPLYYFGKSTFNGSDELKPTMLAKTLKYKEWQVFNSETYNKTIEEIYSAYQEIGHLHCRVDDQKTTRADSIIDVTYDITEGLPSHINLVRIVGNTKTKDKVIRRELSVLPGQTFSRTLLIRSVRDAMALNYFSNVEPAPIDLPNGDVDLEFKVAEKQTGQISAGAGYNSTDKLVGNLGLGIPNLGGNGQSLSINLERGANLNSISLSFTEPWMFGRPTLFGADLFSTNRRWYSDYTEGRVGGAARLGRRLSWPDNYFRVFASYSLERNRFTDFDPSFRASNSYKALYYTDVAENINGIDTFGTYNPEKDTLRSTTVYGPYPGSVLEDSTWQTASQFSFTISRDSRNLPEFATKGSQLSYTLEHAGGILGGYWHYQKHSFTVAKFVPLFWKFSLAAKAQYQFITSPEGDNRVLLSDRFTPGGTNYDGIVRGFEDGSLTPDSIVSQGDTAYLVRPVGIGHPVEDTTVVPGNKYSVRVRGKYMFVTNWEIQLPIAKQQFYTIFFFDAGNSWLYQKDVLKKLYSGAGIGFRIVVPGIGTIGFDFAHPLVYKP